MKWLTFIFAIVVILSTGIFFYQHEQVHVTIYEGYGIESRVEYFGHGWAFVTIPEASCPNSFCELAHDMNEVVGYQLGPFLMLLGLGLFFIIMMMEGYYEEQIKAMNQLINNGPQNRGVEQSKPST